MKLSTVFLLSSTVAAVAVTGYDWGVKPAIHALMYDDRPPIRFLNAHLRQTKLQVGAQTIEFSFTYSDKRQECHPPLAEPGLIRFRIWLNGNDWVWLRFENRSYAPWTASSSPHTMPFRAIPLPPLAPGNYIFQWTATYNCLGASAPITIASPKLPFEIEDKT